MALKSGRNPLFKRLSNTNLAVLDDSGPGKGLLNRLKQRVSSVVAEIDSAVTDFMENTELGREGQEVIRAIGARVSVIDDSYQQWITDHIDPLFGSQRQQQLEDLAGGRKMELSPRQKQANYSLALGVTGLGLALLANVVAIPIGLISAAIGLYIVAPWLQYAVHKTLHERRLSAMHLMLVYFAGLWVGGYLVVGTAGLILTALARKVRMFSEDRTRGQLVNIFGRQPQEAWMLVDGVETEVPIEQVQVGDILVIDVSQTIPVDGVIVEGVASIDQHMLTGESQPAEKGVGDSVLAATVVLAGRIFVRVERAGAETTATKIGEILNHTARYRLSAEDKSMQMIDRAFVPLLIGSGLGLVLIGPVGAIAVLGCNYTMGMIGLTPLTLLNFLNESSRYGILVKDGDALEKLHGVDTFVFDKTGTLTIEQPQIVQIHTCSQYGEEDVLRLAAAAERRQSHPIAQAILAAAAERQIVVPEIADAHYDVGYGITVRAAIGSDADGAVGDAQKIRVGSSRFMEMEDIGIPDGMQALIATCQAQGHSLVFVAVDDQLIGALELKATVRPEARHVVDELHRRGMTLYIISGDQEGPTRTLAEDLGMDGYFANTLPERKADLVDQLKAEGRKVCFIGDGINDAIALKKADVSISLRGATTAATDTAQVVLMDADLSQVLVLLELVEKLQKNLNLNFNVAMGLSALSATGVLFFHAGFAIVETVFAGQIVTGVGIASMPLLKQKDE
jgi:heavy metal translocating P-type ATPase